LSLRAIDWSHHSKEEQPEEWDCSYASLPFFPILSSIASCICSWASFCMKAQDACNSFSCQPKPNNVQGQQRGRFFVCFLLKVRNLSQQQPNRLLFISLTKIVSHVGTKPFLDLRSNIVALKFFQPMMTHHD
jgi:hypothetical protein